MSPEPLPHHMKNPLRKHPAVTVMMPAYNAAKYLAASLRSVLGQDCCDFEIVLVDDASTDQTYEVAKQFRRDPRLRLYKNRTRKGIVATRNRILSLARGTYVAPHDADDIMLPGRLKAQLSILKSQPSIGGVFGLALRVWGRNKFDIIGCRNIHTNGTLSEGTVKTIPDDFHHCSSTVRKKLLLNAGGYDGLLSQGEDRRLFRCLFRKAPFYFIKRFCLIYRKHPHSSSETYIKMRSRFLKNIFSHETERTNWKVKIRDIVMPLDQYDLESKKKLLWRFNLYAEKSRNHTCSFSSASATANEFMQSLGKRLVRKECSLINAALLSKDDKGVLIFFETQIPRKGVALLAFSNKGYVYHCSDVAMLDFGKKTLWSGECIDPLIVDTPKSLRSKSLLWNPLIKKWYLAMDLFRIGSVGGRCPISKIVTVKFKNPSRGILSKRLSQIEKRAIIERNLIYSPPRAGKTSELIRLVEPIPAYEVSLDWKLLKKCASFRNKDLRKDLLKLTDLI